MNTQGLPETDCVNLAFVDDDEDDYLLLDLYLTEANNGCYLLHFLPPGTDFLKEVCSRKFQLVLTNHRINGISGLDIIKMIQENCSDVPVIMVTAWQQEGLRADAERMGAAAFLLKQELNADLLTQTIEKVMNGST